VQTAAENSQNPSLLVVGCGDLGAAVATHFAKRGWRVYGMRRSAAELDGVDMLTGDVTQPHTLTGLRELRVDYVLVVLTPGGFSDERYRAVYVEGTRNVLRALDTRALKRVFWVSSTSVYHQNDGEWVDEDSPARPTAFSGARLLEAENLIAASGLAHTCVRFGGIYGPGRDRLLRQLRGGQCSPLQPPRYSNRIHRDDTVAVLQFLLESAARGVDLQSLYVAVDTEPALLSDIERWFCDYLRIDYAALSPDAPPARGGSRRCSSARLQALGYAFIYPSYREGLPSLLAPVDAALM